MNLTLALEEDIVDRAREVARQQGKSLNAVIRDFLEGFAGRRSGAALANEILEMFEAHPGNSGGKRIRREDAYEGRL